MGLSDIGNLVCLPFEEIESALETDVHELFLQEAVNSLRVSQRNWLPLIVKEIDVDQYEVVANAFVYAAIARAGLEKAWCIVVNDSDEVAEASYLLARDGLPRINLSTASRKQIEAVLDYLAKHHPENPLKGIQVGTATRKIDEASKKHWKTLDPITRLKCRIGRGAKLEALKKVFYLTPEPLPESLTDSKMLEVTFTLGELQAIAKERGLKSSGKKSELIKRLLETE